MSVEQEQTISLVDAICELAKECNGSHIDWGMLAVDEDAAYRMMAMSVIENKDLDNPVICRSTVAALLVENFVLNLKLLKQKELADAK